MSGDTPRPVWLTREQRDVLVWAKNHLECHAHDTPEHRTAHGQLLLGMSQAARDAVTAWDVAPADPVEAGARGLLSGDEDETERQWARELTVDVLRALGYPGLAPDTKEDTT